MNRVIKIAGRLAANILVVSLSACGGPKQARVNVPPPPQITEPPVATPPDTNSANTSASSTEPSRANKRSVTADRREGSESAEEAANVEPAIPAGAPVILTETGIASWYGPPYNHRRASNGEVYDMNAMTAAHRTLPLGSIVRVINVNNGLSVVVRITDRGPFIPGRVIDLSLAAARKIDVWRAGVAPVRLEVLETPAPIDAGGKWAVQIGGFQDEEQAETLADRLTRRYHSARVSSFASPAGDWWIRVRVLGDNHARASQLASETNTPEGAVFLVRLD